MTKDTPSKDRRSEHNRPETVAQSRSDAGPKPALIAAEDPTESMLQRLETVIGCGPVWASLEEVQARQTEAKVAGPTRRQRAPMDFVVLDAAAWLCGSLQAAIKHLSDPDVWNRLRRAARREFPNDPRRRLSNTPPSRAQHYRARHVRFCGEALADLGRAFRREAVRAARRMGMFDPTTGSWADPDATQCISGDSTWIRDVRGSDASDCIADGRLQRGRRLVMLACGTGHNRERIILDAELVPPRTGSSADARTEAAQAVAMLGRLLADNGDLLRPGLRGFVYDMAMTSKDMDRVFDVGLLPITKVPLTADGGHRRVSLGSRVFVADDGTHHDLVVHAVNGAPAVTVTGSDGIETQVRLRRHSIHWQRQHDNASVAWCVCAVPDDSAVPAHLRGATTAVRLNSSPDEAQSFRTRRTFALRAIPEGDHSFALHSTRAELERMFADLKQNPRSRRSPLTADGLGMLAYQMLQLAVALDAYHRRTSPTKSTQAAA